MIDVSNTEQIFNSVIKVDIDFQNSNNWSKNYTEKWSEGS